MPKSKGSQSNNNALRAIKIGSGRLKPGRSLTNGDELHQDVPHSAEHKDGVAHLTDNFGYRIAE